MLGLERGTEFAFPDMSYNDVFVYGQTIQFPPDLRVREICSILINCDARQSLKATKVVSQYITVNKLENDAMRLLLERTWGKKFGQLSLGEQKLLFCHFMGHMNRKLFIIDEVTSGIDPGHRKTIIDSLQKISSKAVVLLSTHILDDLDDVDAMVSFMKDQKIMFSKPIQDVKLKELYV